MDARLFAVMIEFSFWFGWLMCWAIFVLIYFVTKPFKDKAEAKFLLECDNAHKIKYIKYKGHIRE